MEILKHLQDVEKEIEKEWTEILFYRVWRRYGYTTGTEVVIGRNGTKYTAISRDKE
jgi:hypothetical protein